MVGRRFPAIALILAMAAPPVLAETYKWVDAKGVVNYSSSPPPASAKAQVVGERISVLPPDPSLGPAVAAMQARAERRAKDEEADFARRQQYQLQVQANQAAADCSYGAYGAYGGNCGFGYDAPLYYPYAVAGSGYRARAGRRHAPYVSHYEDLPNYSDLPSYPGTRAAYQPGGRTVYGAGAMQARGATFQGRASFR